MVAAAACFPLLACAASPQLAYPGQSTVLPSSGLNCPAGQTRAGLLAMLGQKFESFNLILMSFCKFLLVWQHHCSTDHCQSATVHRNYATYILLIEGFIHCTYVLLGNMVGGQGDGVPSHNIIILPQSLLNA